MEAHSSKKEKKKDKLDFIQMENFCVSKDTVNRMKRKPTEWEKTSANHTSEKDLISRIKIQRTYKLELNMKRQMTQFKNERGI